MSIRDIKSKFLKIDHNLSISCFLSSSFISLKILNSYTNLSLIFESARRLLTNLVLQNENEFQILADVSEALENPQKVEIVPKKALDVDEFLQKFKVVVK